MKNQSSIYIADLGAITPIGFDFRMSYHAIKASLSNFRETDFQDSDEDQITMAALPEAIFTNFEFEMSEGSCFSEMGDRIIKMMIIAMNESMATVKSDDLVPLIFTLPEPCNDFKHITPEALISNFKLQNNIGAITDNITFIHGGRSAGISAVNQAKEYLINQGREYVLIGGSDSYQDHTRIESLARDERLLTGENSDGFVAGEGAGFLLLTTNPKNAFCINGLVAELHSFGEGQEPGHIYSEEPNLGEGLSRAFSESLQATSNAPAIEKIYSSMNGEDFWAKEFGLAMTRYSDYFHENTTVEHPADCYGDLGAATGTLLIGMAAIDLLNHAVEKSYLAFCSSDYGLCTAIQIKGVSLKSIN